MAFHVIGAGLAGLFASAVLQQECLEVLERQKEVPNNHHAVLRFRTGAFGDAVNIPFTKVPVIKTYIPYVGNIVGDSIAYSLKTNGSATLRSSISADGKPVDRYIAPTDLIQRLLDRGGNKVVTGFTITKHAMTNGGRKYISTMPMPALMELLDYESRPKFVYREGWVLKAKLANCSIFASIYITDPSNPCYRVSITGNELMAEFINEPAGNLYDLLGRFLRMFGMIDHAMLEDGSKPELYQQRYAKILPIDERQRKQFMAWATDEHNVYSFGRFATWRPSLQLDDLVDDLKKIQHYARSASSYDRKKSSHA